MRLIKLLDSDDRVLPTDWCRPMRFVSMGGGTSDHYSDVCEYSGLPMNNPKWIRVEDYFGPMWFDKEVSKLCELELYEFVRGDIPDHHRLKGHESLADMLSKMKHYED